MQVKGIAVIPIKEFVTSKFGQEGCRKWLDSMPESSRELMRDTLLASSWYPYRECLLQPLEALCAIFYQGDPRGAWEEARFAADSALKGIYKVFIRVAKPEYLVRNSSMIFHAYFTDAQIAIAESAKGLLLVHLTKADPPSALFDNVVCGWIEKALEICGCRNLKVAILQSASRNRTHTEIRITWE